MTIETNGFGGAAGSSDERTAHACADAPIGIQWLAPDGTIIWTNRVAAELAGRTVVDWRGSLLPQLDTTGCVASMLARLAPGAPAVSATATVRGDDGVTRHITIDAEGEWHEGTLRTVLCFTRDASARLEAEHELDRADRAALDVLRLKSEFLANVSHEFRTPLNGVMGFTDLALDTNLTGEQRGYLDRARSSAHALLVLVNDLLDFSRVDAGRMQLELAPLQPRTVVEDSVRAFALAAEEKGIELVCDVDADVPQYAIGDAARIRQAMKHLIDNAIKFTDRGEVVVRMSTDSTSADGETVLHVEISDTGIGIPVEQQRSVSDPFVQGDGSSTRRYGGLGIGLTIAEEIVALMRGRLWIENHVGKGSTFHFTVCVRADDTHAAALAAVPTDLDGRAALVVAQEGVPRQILEDLLGRFGMTAKCFDCHDRALVALQARAAAGRPFDVAIINDRAPGSAELVRRIRKIRRMQELPLLVVTAPGDANAELVAYVAGHTITLARPVTESALREALGKVFAQCAQPTRPVTDEQERPGTHPLRVLLAEDDPGCRLIATRSLERRGHMVRAVENGQQALQALAGGQFDVVLMDVQMPGMDGLTTVSAIRRREELRRQHLPIVALTAHGVQGDRERCLDAGMDAYLSKPVDSATLIATVEGVVAHANRAA